MKAVKKSYFNAEGDLIVKPYRLKELAEIYDVHPKTMGRWISDLGPQLSGKKIGYYTVAEISLIVAAIGIPHVVKREKS